jgi:hypothetical protein
VPFFGYLMATSLARWAFSRIWFSLISRREDAVMGPTLPTMSRARAALLAVCTTSLHKKLQVYLNLNISRLCLMHKYI